MPVRRSKLNYQSVGGVLASTRLGRAVRFDSLLERDFFLILDLHRAVEWFEEQPVAIRWTDDVGAVRCYVPDVLIRFRPGLFLARHVRRPVLAELKHRDDLGKTWRRLRQKLQAGFHEADRRGWIFHIFTENRVRGCALANAEFIRKHLHGQREEDAVFVLKRRLADLGQCPAETLALALGQSQRQVGLQTVWSLVALGVFATDLEVPISPVSPIFKGWNYDNEHQI